MNFSAAFAHKHHIKMHNLLCLVFPQVFIGMHVWFIYLHTLQVMKKILKYSHLFKLSDFLFVKKVLKFMLKMTIIKFKSEKIIKDSKYLKLYQF